MEPLPRYELKVWCSAEQAQSVLGALAPLSERDPHFSDESPRYTVTSLYFDTPELAAFMEKIEGERRRSKIRLRRYDDSVSGFLELKAKRGRRMRKWRLALDGPAMAQIAHGDLGPLNAAPDQECAQQLSAAFAARKLRPVVLTQFEREAWRFREDPTVRLTLDTNLRCAGALVDEFLSDDVSELPFLLPEREAAAILEVKVSGPVPSPISRALRLEGLRPTAISKDCLAIQRTQPLPAPLARFPLGAPSKLES